MGKVLGRLHRGVQMGTSLIFYGWRFRAWGSRSILERPYRLLGASNMVFGRSVHVRRGARLEAIWPSREKPRPALVLEDGVSVGQNCHIMCTSSVRIGAGTMVTAGVTIVDTEHGIGPAEVAPAFRELISKPVSIGRNCWIANGAVITAGVTLGDGCTVGANAVVTKGFPAGSVVAGVPAMPIALPEGPQPLSKQTDGCSRFLSSNPARSPNGR
jgi:acetyltransferase-like isoleucine patch superfamily enzyme